MNDRNEPTDRLLHELRELFDEDDRLETEHEQRGDGQSGALTLRRVAQALHGWAKAPVPYEPLDAAQLRQRLEKRERPRRRSHRSWSRPLIAAAASVAILAGLAYAGVGIRVGDRVFAWGMPVQSNSPQEFEAALEKVDSRVAALEEQASTGEEFDRALAARVIEVDRALQEATALLAHYQRLESEARQRDMAYLMNTGFVRAVDSADTNH